MNILPIFLLPNSPAYKARIDTCQQCVHHVAKVVLGWEVVVCGKCNCPIKSKCMSGSCPEKKW